jgi:LuxR family maltose regulon positive regulatory protein
MNSEIRTPILVTKLYRPSVGEGYVTRKGLEAKLEKSLSLPLTVVSAPAGYGKSALISHWLRKTSTSSTWLSLDDSDNDVRLFLTYMVEALRKISADACNGVRSILDLDTIPEPSVVSAHLCNEIVMIGERVVLVLDDYHLISEPVINQILENILMHPPENFHLVIITRHDPMLPLASFRANFQLNEIRLLELAFTNKEVITFFDKASSHSLDSESIKIIHRTTEGWPVGLRLAALAMEGHDNVEKFLNQFGSNSRQLQEYLGNEVLSGLNTQTKEFLLCSSILPRFNASLCEAVRYGVAKTSDSTFSGKDFIAVLEKSGLFSISLDDTQNWVRFHHLFGSFLQQRLEQSHTKEKISELHRNASHWFLSNGFIEDAIHHALASGNTGYASDIVGEARHDLMNGDEWHRLARWLKLFSFEAVQNYPNLLLLRCWLNLYYFYRLDTLAKDLDAADTLLESPLINAVEASQLKAEVASIRSNLTCWMVKPSLSGNLAKQVLRDTPSKHECVQSTAIFGWGASCQMLDDLHQGERIIWDRLEHGHFKHPSSHARFLLSLVIAYWPEAEPTKLHQVSNRLLSVSLESKLPWSESFARFFLGLTHYELNELSEAKKHLEVIVNDPYRYPIQNVTHCSFLLSLTHEAQGFSDRAIEVATKISNFTFERNNAMFVHLSEAFMAYLELTQGRISRASHWAKNYEMPAPHLMQRLFNSELAYARVLIAQDTAESCKIASENLDKLEDILIRTNNKRLMIDVMGMKAIIADTVGDSDTAGSYLKKAILLGQPGLLIRPLVDLGPRLIKPLNGLDMDQEGLQYVGMILSGLQNKKAVGSTVTESQLPIEVLSQRELEILNLFKKEMSNNEIAEKLFISPGTVKRHAHNIYSKLSVSGRRNAVSKAAGLGILTM